MSDWARRVTIYLDNQMKMPATQARIDACTAKKWELELTHKILPIYIHHEDVLSCGLSHHNDVLNT